MVAGDQSNRQQSLKTNAMNGLVILKTFLAAVTPNMHKVRRASLPSCVSSLLNGAKANITGMVRGISSSAYEKHRIKQAYPRVSTLYLRSYISSLQAPHHAPTFSLIGLI
jgi:hypothetical protein